MSWTTAQADMLAELGVHWVRGDEATLAAPSATAVVPSEGGEAQPVRALAPADARVARPEMPTPARPAAHERPLRGHESATDSLDWEALRETVRACRACSLCESRRQTVFGVGHPRAHWMVVGEAPGEQEDLKGEPFVGAAGRLLDNMLQALGLTRHVPTPETGLPAVDEARQVYIANTLKCRPPGNRNPAPEELARCEPFLMRQIELLQPRLILAMGRFAIQSLLRSAEPVGRLRGQVHRYQGVPLICTYHPAYLLRNPADKSKAWEDLCLAHDVMTRGGATTRDP